MVKGLIRLALMHYHIAFGGCVGSIRSCFGIDRNTDCIHPSTQRVSAMPHTSSITYLPLPSWLEASVEEARSATSNTVVSDSQRWAFEFELPVNEGVKRVVDEAKKVYLVCSNTLREY
ncbi:predicted protein [Histoplasma mississippiense (nom. inval.)]|uniref:predicted protein n=1 Tax=Ajellomyces capsulatus (strain NAm1 / WU24) TaxID=2059318 RepID=UPI000157BE0F|nr:predicted protein [Histoplasma mississippiense (nom. inval.)]EDN06079.1 predicted protein [Histoplasma mississippiense (nom. inval.)]